MHVIVIGLGQVGRHVTKILEEERHDVVAVDVSADALEWVSDHHDVMTVLGYGANFRLLANARAGDADLVLAVTSNDETNLLAALACKRMGAKRVLARTQGVDWSTNGPGDRGVTYDLLGIDVVFNPSILIANEVFLIAQSHGALEVIDIASDRIEVAQMEMGEQGRLLHRAIANLQLPKNVLIGAIVRDGEIRVPGGADVLLPGDRVYLIGEPEQVLRAEDRFSDQREANRVCIAGGGVIGHTLAKQLEHSGAEVMMVVSNREEAERLAADLEGVTVLHGEATHLELLQEESVGNYDLFAAVSDDDEENLMAGLLAKRLGVHRVVTVTHRSDYSSIYQHLGIDIVLSPRTAASEHILKYCRQAKLESLTLIEGGKAELLEFVTPEDCPVLATPVHKMGIPRGALLCAILRGDTTIVPTGNDQIAAGDTVIVLCLPNVRPRVVRMFGGRSS